MKLDVILRVTTKLMIPFIVLFALYVQFHGDFGPGGGFQAGVIIAGAIILYAIIFGLRSAQRVISQSFAEILVPLGIGIYALVGVICMINGENFLNYSALDPNDTKHGQHMGVILIEVGVLVTVAGTMVAIFYAFAGRGR